MFDISPLQEKLEPLTTSLKEQVQAELWNQNHRATETLINSIHVEVEAFAEGLAIVGYGEFYGQYVDRGRPPGARKVPIDALIEWIKVKGFEKDEKKIRSIAFAIQKKTFDEGNRIFREPKRYSNFIGNVLKRNEPDIKEFIEKNFTELVEDFVSSQLQNVTL